MTTAGIVLVSGAFAAWAVGGVWVSVIDLREQILPKRIIWPTCLAVLVLYVAAAAVEGDFMRLLQAVLASGSCGAIFAIIYFLYPRGMGFGDVRLVTMNGLAVGWFGISPAWVSIVLAFVLAFPMSIWFLATKGISQGMTTQSPFGPYLVAGTALMSIAEATGITNFP